MEFAFTTQHKVFAEGRLSVRSYEVLLSSTRGEYASEGTVTVHPSA